VCWEQLPVLRYSVQHATTGQKEVIHYTPKGRGGLPASAEPTVREVLESHRTTRVDPQHWSITRQELLVDWLAENYREFGARLSFVSGNSELGNQFVQSFGGLGAVLRYRVDFEALGVGVDQDDDEASGEGDEEEDDFDDFTFDDISSEPRPKPVDPKEEVLEFDDSDFEEDSDGQAADQQRQLLLGASSALSPDWSEGKGKEKLTDAVDENKNSNSSKAAASSIGNAEKKATATGAPARLAGAAMARPLSSKVKYTEKAFVPPSGSAASASRAN